MLTIIVVCYFLCIICDRWLSLLMCLPLCACHLSPIFERSTSVVTWSSKGVLSTWWAVKFNQVVLLPPSSLRSDSLVTMISLFPSCVCGKIIVVSPKCWYLNMGIDSNCHILSMSMVLCLLCAGLATCLCKGERFIHETWVSWLSAALYLFTHISLTHSIKGHLCI